MKGPLMKLNMSFLIKYEDLLQKYLEESQQQHQR